MVPNSSVDVSFDIPAGVPFWGKGENSYDGSMDGAFGIGTYWDGNIYQAAKRIALRCLEIRSRRGSLSENSYSKWRRERLGMPAIVE